MAKPGRVGLGLWDRLVLLLAWGVTCGLVYLLGFYVGKGMQERPLGPEDRLVRLPVTSTPPPEGQRPKADSELTFYDTLTASERHRPPGAGAHARRRRDIGTASRGRCTHTPFPSEERHQPTRACSAPSASTARGGARSRRCALSTGDAPGRWQLDRTGESHPQPRGGRRPRPPAAHARLRCLARARAA